MPTVGPIPSPDAPQGPLSATDLALLGAAREASRKIRRTVSVARMSAWTTGIFGGLSMLGLALGDLSSLVIGGVLIFIAVRESQAAGRLAKLDVAAPRELATNQLAFAGVILAYCIWQGISATRSTALAGMPEPTGDPQVDAMLGDFGAIAKTITLWFYVLVAVGGVAGTGMMALYYSRRARLVREFVDQTPAWVVQVIRAGV